MSIRHRLILAVAVGNVFACESTSGPEQLRISGKTFDVVQVDGRALPTTTSMSGQGGCGSATMTRGTISFEAGGTMRLSRRTGNATTPAMFQASYSQDPQGNVTVAFEGMSATLRGADTVVVRVGPMVSCVTEQWTAVLQ
jgi:hypothetical protein